MSNTVNNYTETDLGNISLNPRGEYDNSAAYEYLDTVSYRGGSYFCLAELETTITGIAPDAGRNSKYWQMIATPGDMTPEYTAAYNDVINKAVQVETSRAAVELAQQEIETSQADVQELHSDTVQAAQEAENSKNSAANSAQSAEQSRKTVSESEQNINGQIAGFDSRVSEAVEQSKEEINTTKQQAINTITNQQTTSVNTVKTEGEKIITRVGNDAKTVADDRATVEEAAQTVLNNAQEVAQNTQTVASNTENVAASAESAKTSADNAAQSAKSVEDASKQIEQNKKDVASLKEDLSNKITKFYASNQGETHLADSDNCKIMDMMLYGRCEQQTTTGKNLFDVTKIDNSILQTSSINIVKVDRQSGLIEAVFNNNYQQLGIIIPEEERDATYTIKLHQVNDKNDKIDIRAYTIKNNAISEYVNGAKVESNIIILTFNITAGTQFAVWFRPNGVYGAGNKNVCKFSNIQLEKGSEATSFEPYTGSQPSPSRDYPQEIKSVVNPTVKVSNEDGTKSQTVALPYTLNAIPVSSGGNVTIDGQQYVADYVDVEREKLVRMVDSSKLDNTQSIVNKTEWLLAEPQEIDLTTEENTTFKALATYYPTTNISINSEQLDGYTVFNYPVSMQNGWNYVKQQLNDNRDYIYDMDTKTQGIDTQAAEAYVNSEYAVALTELEV